MLQGLKNGYLFQFAVFTTIKDNAFLSASNCPCISKTILVPRAAWPSYPSETEPAGPRAQSPTVKRAKRLWGRKCSKTRSHLFIVSSPYSIG